MLERERTRGWKQPEGLKQDVDGLYMVDLETGQRIPILPLLAEQPPRIVEGQVKEAA